MLFDKLNFDLQLFAPDPDPVPDPQDPTPPKDPEPDEKTTAIIKAAVEAAQKIERSKYDTLYTQSDKDKKELEKIQKENEKLLLDGKSAKEIAEHNAKKEREAFDNERSEFEKNKLELFTVKKMSKEDMILPASFKPFINGNSEDQITANIIKLKSVFEKEIQNALESKLKDYNKKPDDSDNKTDLSSLETQYEQAKKDKNIHEITRLNRLIYEKKNKK